MQQYYYSRDGAAGSSNSVDQGYPPSSSSYGADIASVFFLFLSDMSIYLKVSEECHHT